MLSPLLPSPDMNILFIKYDNNFTQIFVRNIHCCLSDVFRQFSIKSFGNTAGNAGHGIAVAAKQNYIPDGIFKVFRLQESSNRLGA